MRIDDYVTDAVREYGNVVFVMTEFQIADRETVESNEVGEGNHEAYKSRQHESVRRRLMRGPTRTEDDRSSKLRLEPYRLSLGARLFALARFNPHRVRKNDRPNSRRLPGEGPATDESDCAATPVFCARCCDHR